MSRYRRNSRRHSPPRLVSTKPEAKWLPRLVTSAIADRTTRNVILNRRNLKVWSYSIPARRCLAPPDGTAWCYATRRQFARWAHRSGWTGERAFVADGDGDRVHEPDSSSCSNIGPAAMTHPPSSPNAASHYLAPTWGLPFSFFTCSQGNKKYQWLSTLTNSNNNKTTFVLRNWSPNILWIKY